MRTGRAGGPSRPSELDWFEPWRTVARRHEPAVLQVVRRRPLNASYNCLDRHVAAGRGDRVAYHWHGEEGGERDDHLRRPARATSSASPTRCAGLGVKKGDVVGIYLPMIPEVVVAMLACARIGAPHNVVFGGFSAEAVRERMEFSRGQRADHRRRRRAARARRRRSRRTSTR